MKTMKKMKFLACMAAIAMIATSLTACNDDDKNNGNGGGGIAENELSGELSADRTLDANITYHLVGPYLIADGATLTIPAGTRIEAKNSFGAYILVLQGGKIKVMGTEDAPVVMTADSENANPGHWGGLIINGKAKVSGIDNEEPKYGATEISNAYRYGGTDDSDSSGEIHFLVLEYTGNKSSANVEHNGLTLNGVGNGTKINDVFVIDGADDGIEFFGGSVDVENLLVVNSDDDMFDFTMGYSGELKNAYGIWEAGFTTSEADPRGIEADGNQDGDYPSDSPQSNFMVTNVTFDLRVPYIDKEAGDYQTKSMDDVIKIRRSAKAVVTNALVTGVTHVEDLVDLTDSGNDANLATQVDLRTQLTTAADRAVNPTDGSYTQVTTDNTTNTGCAQSVFDWTGYAF